MLLWLLWPLAGAAQELMPSAWQYYIEQLSDEGDDETVEEMLELYEALHDSPVNLNDTSDLLSAIPFVSDLQRERLRAYILLSGALPIQYSLTAEVSIMLFIKAERILLP